MLATLFWGLVTLGAVIAGFQETPLYLLAALTTGAYTVYLARGGRFRLFII
jgi:hypothetical protein